MKKEAVTPEHREACRHMSERIIEPLRKVAREYGYAIGVHGSLERDIDLIAVPWVAEACPEPELAKVIQQAAADICGRADMGWSMTGGPELALAGFPGRKPHGRLVWSFHLGDEIWIDLSIMPKLEPAK